MSAYDDLVLSDSPILFLENMMWMGDDTPQKSVLPNGEQAVHFNGTSTYVEINDANALSLPQTGELTIEAWLQPTTLLFPKTEGSGYVHWLGKGETGQQEYTMRMYSANNTEGRENRISAYVFNKTGGNGSGSYFQDKIIVGNWTHVVATMTLNEISIWRDGTLRATTLLSQFNVTPENGTAPLRIGTRDKQSFFQGGIGKVAFYNKVLLPARITAHFDSMRGAVTPPA
jgi:hypothetical protein